MTVAKETRNDYIREFERSGVLSVPNVSWIADLKQAAIRRFAELDFPTTRLEDWKYTNVSEIARGAFRAPAGTHLGQSFAAQLAATPGASSSSRIVFVDGSHQKELSSGLSSGQLSSGRLSISSLAERLITADHLRSELGRYADFNSSAFVALNTAFIRDGAAVTIPAREVFTDPIYIVYFSTGTERAAFYPRNLILAGEGSQATIVEAYVGASPEPYFTNGVTEVVLGDGAVLRHCKLQNEGEGAFHISRLQVRQGRSSTLTSHQIDLGAALARNDINAVLDGEGAECSLNGLYIESGSQHVDNHTLIDHAKPNGSSRETFKGILDGRATGVFNGSILVRKDAQKTDAKQSNRNLLLSPEAEINTKPQLEIFADDVKCSHGATIGHMDQESIFYMRARGIDLETAMSMLTYAFCNEVLESIADDRLRNEISDAVFAKVRARGASEKR